MRKPHDINPVLSRRAILRAALATGGGLMLSGMIPGLPGARAQSGSAFTPNAFIRIDRNGAITFIMRHVEMGQGIYTGIAMLLAEELEVSLDKVRLEAAPANASYIDKSAGEEVTGGSASTRDSWVPLRQAGAAARIMLIQAASTRWSVPASTCVARDGAVLHPESSRRLDYGALADDAAHQKIPDPVPLKNPSQFQLIGTSPQRMDTHAKSNGTACFGMDVRVEGMKTGRIMACPVKGGRLKGFDREAALKTPGVTDIVTLPDAIAVIGDHSWAAISGMKAARPEWDYGPHSGMSSATQLQALRSASEKTGIVAKNTGDVTAALASSPVRIDAIYESPFLAHAALEPINTTLHIRSDSADVWVGTQVPLRARQEVADATGLPPERITVHNHLIGGGFGRRLDSNSIGQAARLAKQVPFPVKLFWTREEDIRQDQFRPFYYDRITAGLDDKGLIKAWHHRTTGSFVLARWAPEGLQNGLDSDAVEGATETPYAIPSQRNEAVQCEPEGITTLWWRGVGPTHNVFVVEGMIDELAHASGTDPLSFRRRHLTHSPRGLKVLDEAARQAGWGRPLPKGHGLGIALHYSFQCWAATVLEVEVGGGGEIRLIRADTAVDCGPVVFPDAVRAQIQGGLIFGLTMALYNEITFRNGQAEQSNFHNYRMMRLNEAPDIRVHLVSDPDAEIGGIGEVGTVAAAPVLANAIFAATGRRLRRIPFAPQLAMNPTGEKKA
ncbi:xanthine dehydrogenase family protein molybdopterin-binding subunit [Asaia krungthepensis]|uniref:Aldehyde dehydrogenase large subunit n=1 Tax=Asaia krungthepensis NRIC 0535 TaxID=1307925 RepID=A0ABQ0PVD4_9PROT|nr:xanthine dehydrogenase family protein molybdopterin-binding subunit [Asaia krungthepensis]GBQ82570.1 aldehyde dehydrogenase large subunit [Asaia krungthepensis NRIC 0535]